MDLAGLATLLTAIIAALTATGKLVIEYGRRLEREAQTKRTLAAKDAEIAELKAEKDQLEAWLDALTRPPGRSP